MELAAQLEDVEVVVCAGSGGVGKTTTSASIAIGMAARGLKVAVLTIDPAKRLADSLAAFRAALAEIGSLNTTTTFTMSDFGRTLNSNGNGTDHGWGGVQLVMGGAAANGGPLRGQQVWGQYPVLELDGTQAVGRGRMVPTLSVNQVGSTLAQWFGLPSSSVASIFPGIENFSQQKLGFLG